MVEETYNPFKMWGSYLVAVIITIYNLYPSFKFGWAIGDEVIYPSVFYILGQSIYLIFYSLVFGFLIGWGLHSLLRYIGGFFSLPVFKRIGYPKNTIYMKEQDRFLLIAILIILVGNLAILSYHHFSTIEDREYDKYYSECFSFPSDLMTDLSVNHYICDKYANYMIDYGSDHFVCYYGKNSECESKFCPSHVTKERCEELGGSWFRENGVMDMMQRFDEVFGR